MSSHFDNQANGEINSQIRDSTGFTLLEILIAVLIFAIVIATLFSSFKAFMISSEGVKEDLLQTEKIATVYKRISLDLESIFVLQEPRYSKPEFDSEPDPYGLLGNKETIGQKIVSALEFSSLAHAKTGMDKRAGVARIAYYIRENESNGLDLCRADVLSPFQDAIRSCTDPVLCQNISKFEIIYQDFNKDEYKFWDSESLEFKYAFPSAIDFKIIFGTGEQQQKFVMSFNIIPLRQLNE